MADAVNTHEKIRLGNDIGIRWSLIDEEGSPYIFDGRDVSVEIDVGGKKRYRVKELTHEANTLIFTYWGMDQKTTGVCSLKFIENDGNKEMVTFDIPNAFELVPHSWLTGSAPENERVQLSFVTLTSSLTERIGPMGPAAGFGEITATIDALVGTPSVAVITSGPDTAKNITFVFSSLKGEPGHDAEITAESIIAALGYTPANAATLPPLEKGGTATAVRMKNTGVVASGNAAFAIGKNTTASGGQSFASGDGATASGNRSHAEGKETQAAGQNSHAEGMSTLAYGQNAHAEGESTSVSGEAAHAEGGNTNATGTYSHAEGRDTLAQGEAAHAEGRNTKAKGYYSHTEGEDTTANGYAAHTEGKGTSAGGYAHAEGRNTTAQGEAAHAEGANTLASGYNSHAEGSGSTASGNISHAEGEDSVASGTRSHAEGNQTVALGDNSHAEGGHTEARGNRAHAEGERTEASGDSSHAEGSYSIASGSAAHAEGKGNEAYGAHSHAEGIHTIANGDYSHAEGEETVAQNRAEHAQGYFNKSNVKTNGTDEENDAGSTLFSIGNGSDNNRQNAFEVMRNGDVYIQGAGGYAGKNPTAATSLQTLLASFITNSVNNLVNYYTKSETFTKAEVLAQIADAIKGGYMPVATLPTASADTMGKIYLVPSSDPQTQNIKDEFVTIDNGASADPRYTWEQIGSTAISLDGLVRYDESQTLTAAEKTRARGNIGAQNALVSGTNIKKFAGKDLLGSGDVTITLSRTLQLGMDRLFVFCTCESNIPEKFSALVNVPNLNITALLSAGTNGEAILYDYSGQVHSFYSSADGDRYWLIIEIPISTSSVWSGDVNVVCLTGDASNYFFSCSGNGGCPSSGTSLPIKKYYSKPSGGIPKTDLAAAVQTSLEKADSALQSVKTLAGQSLTGSGDVVQSVTSNSETPYLKFPALTAGTTALISAKNGMGFAFISYSFEDGPKIYDVRGNLVTGFYVVNNSTSIDLYVRFFWGSNAEHEIIFLTGAPVAVMSVADYSGNEGSILHLYSKPSTGIPATDLAQAVQASLALAHAALPRAQSVVTTALYPAVKITIEESTGTVLVSNGGKLLFVKKTFGEYAATVLLGDIERISYDSTSCYVMCDASVDSYVLFLDCTGTITRTALSPFIQSLPVVRKVTSISAQSTDYEYPSAKAVYDAMEQSAASMTEITYYELLVLRDSDMLTPGMQYRITDYHTTTTQEDTRSADHQFDIIVTADSVNTLNENARACMSGNDDYFDEANAKLESWRLKYCLDNDTDRFAWAKQYLSPETTMPYIRVKDGVETFIYVRYPSGDNEDGIAWAYAEAGDSMTIEEFAESLSETLDPNDLIYTQKFPSLGDILNMSGTDVETIDLSWGTGVIYRMIDEWNNDCPYDFKNIQFKRPLTDGEYDPDEGTDTWVYTFNGYNLNAGTYYDMSTTPFRISEETKQAAMEDGDGADDGDICYGNKISERKAEDEANAGYMRFAIKLNDIVFLGSSYDNGYDDGFGVCYCYFNTFESNCYSNTFGNGCTTNTFGSGCYSNTFGNNCVANTFGNNCVTNTFGNGCLRNTFGNNCFSNTFGFNCTTNTFGNGCNYNTFGYGCNSNTFGDGCVTNTFGHSCTTNTFGHSCNYNTFGNNCGSNAFGNGSLRNTFGDSCYYNTFGDGCNEIKFGNSSSTKGYYRNIIVESGNQYIYLYCSATTSSSYPYRNVRIALGVNNTTTWKTITDSDRNQTYETEYQPANSQIISV